ncbi:MAG: tRNA uridine-5-carboxymethylaminomethyl(34) synthesis GTPase MnmE [Chitinophagaceae bacterium]|nr:tRNA uridine-5-carboxymethylaminomethyl(34) synthesis GTPase MnmE [Chitinophagaceae bacterium]
MHTWDDTIIALATPPGIGAIGVIRISGKNAISIANKIFPSKNLADQLSHTLHVGNIKSGDNILDEAVVSIFKAPKSYTGEDVIEISCHGSPFVQQQVIEACTAGGARLAKPGEFTQRAFLNGKLDLAQAEAVADLIASETQASRDTALHAMRGGFSNVLKELREQMIRFSALIELELDFSQEDVEFADRSQFYKLLNNVKEVTARLLESFKYGNVIRNGVRVAIVGKPNAGKSTLLNNLLNENRAIVSDIAGTTRDTIEEVINIDGILFRLIDTAGLRDETGDIIEKAGMEKTFEKIREADVVMYVFDVNEMPAEELGTVMDGYASAGSKLLLVGNKIDINGEEYAKNKFGLSNAILLISARDEPHLDELKKRLVSLVLHGKINTEDTVVTNARHYEALKAVNASIDDILKGLDAQLPGDLLALDIRRALHFLGEITGQITTEDQLDYIFSKFCIGK